MATPIGNGEYFFSYPSPGQDSAGTASDSQASAQPKRFANDQLKYPCDPCRVRKNGRPAPSKTIPTLELP